MKHDRMLGTKGLVRFACTVVAFLASASPAAAATLFVGNDGVDGPECGAKTVPCRSINRALGAAADGDTIIVGPGRYGDLDRDGVLSGAGEEQPNPLGFNCQCAIQIFRAVTVVSREGPGETIIDIGGAEVNGIAIDAVRVGHGAAFGKPKKGFTVTGAGAGAAAVHVPFAARGTRIAGNRAVANQGYGFVFEGLEGRVEGNRAYDNGTRGFLVAGNDNVITGNLAQGNNHPGFELRGRGHLIKGNSASANGVGFFAGAPDTDSLTLLGNVAAGNTFEGFVFYGNGHVVSGNAAIGNGGSGMLFEGASSSTLTVTRNTFMGNGRNGNCGIDTGNVDGEPVAVAKSYWGAPTGPGPDPADEACGGEVVTPFATAEIKVSPKPKPVD